jgi:hypothetical protein
MLARSFFFLNDDKKAKDEKYKNKEAKRKGELMINSSEQIFEVFHTNFSLENCV